jgi:hypothetical protein
MQAILFDPSALVPLDPQLEELEREATEKATLPIGLVANGFAAFLVPRLKERWGDRLRVFVERAA